MHEVNMTKMSKNGNKKLKGANYDNGHNCVRDPSNTPIQIQMSLSLHRVQNMQTLKRIVNPLT